MKKFTLLPLAALALAGCSLNRTAARVTSGVIDKGLPAVFAQEDPRYVKEALPANLQLMEILLASDPGNRKMLVNAAQGFCGYAFMFLEDDEPARASAFYLKGRAYAGRAFAADPAAAKKKDVPALFWRTFCTAAHININRHDPEAIAELPAVEPAARKILELDPGYYYNGAQAILGSYYAIRPRMLGGDPEKAKAHFELALQGAGGRFMLNHYMYALMAAVAAQDRKLFEAQLNAVIGAEPAAGDTRLPDEVARTKAGKLLEKKDELFEPEEENTDESND